MSLKIKLRDVTRVLLSFYEGYLSFILPFPDKCEKVFCFSPLCHYCHSVLNVNFSVLSEVRFGGEQRERERYAVILISALPCQVGPKCTDG